MSGLEQPRLRSKVKTAEPLTTDLELLLAPRPAGVTPSLSDQAYKALEELLVTAKLAPGSIWSEPALSALTGFGRSPIREALQRLTSDHLVVPLRRHGFRITEVQVEEQLLVLEARRELERLVSVFAARRASAAERETLHRGCAAAAPSWSRSQHPALPAASFCAEAVYRSQRTQSVHRLGLVAAACALAPFFLRSPRPVRRPYRGRWSACRSGRVDWAWR